MEILFNSSQFSPAVFAIAGVDIVRLGVALGADLAGRWLPGSRELGRDDTGRDSDDLFSKLSCHRTIISLSRRALSED
jgi:hypothetical protein